MAKTYVLPYNLEAEKAVLGAMLIDFAAATIGISSLTEESFSDVDPRNRLVFKAINLVWEESKNNPSSEGAANAIDVTTILNTLKLLKVEQESGGIDYLTELVGGVISVDNMPHYTAIVKNYAVLRDLLKASQRIQDEYATGGIEDINEFVMRANDSIAQIANKRSVGQFQTAAEIAETVKNNIEALKNHAHNNLTGVDTGYERLNIMTHGWQKEELIIVAARPSVGKTALALNFAINAATRTGKPVGFFSLEMSGVTIMQRILACLASVPNEHIQTGILSNQERVRLNGAIDQVKKTSLFIDSTPNALLGDITAKATRLKAQFDDLALIVVDYMGIIRTTSKGKEYSRQQEVSEISSAMKVMARQLHVPVIVVCQVNRNADDNNEGKPKLSNLRDSGSIEQDADMVLLLSRDDYGDNALTKKKRGYGEAPEESDKPKVETGPGDVSIMEVNLAKNRNGKTGKFNLAFQKAYSRFDNLASETEERLAEASRFRKDDEE